MGNILDGIDKKTLIAKFETFILQKKAFLQQTLTLEDVATQLGISKNILSAVINAHFEANFNTIVNSYRVEHAKYLLINKRSTPILDIGYESGFNSKSSFYSAFKKFTRKTPIEFKNCVRNN